MNRTHDAMENWLHAVQLNSKHVLAWTNLIALLDNTGDGHSIVKEYYRYKHGPASARQPYRYE